MKIAILYICTDKYDIFWDKFYESAEKYLFPNHIKNYFVFTDSKKRNFYNNPKIHITFQKKLGWPYDTLMRFEMFEKKLNELSKFDYIYFFNANIVFLDQVEDDLLPDEINDNGLVGVLHPGFYNKDRKDFTYETNSKSTASILPNEGLHYFMGGVNGGKSDKYLNLIKILRNNIHNDLKNNIIALWHDESHLNRYFVDHKCKILTPEYGYPEDWNLPFSPKILILDKNKFGGHSNLRNNKISYNIFKLFNKKN